MALQEIYERSPADPEIMTVESATVHMLARAEIDIQIATAKKYPRSIQTFRNEITGYVTLTEGIAQECVYALPREGKTIEGPSARFAEIALSCWGNSRAGARVIDESDEFVTAQGVFHDLQRNTAVTINVQRRITNSRGKRYGADMIMVTGNAAGSIALRNAILKGIPKPFWVDAYEAARKTIRGDFQTLANRRAAALQAFQGFGLRPEQVFALLQVKGTDDIALDHIVTLRGFLTALKEGDTTPEDLLAQAAAANPGTPPPAPKSGKRAEKPKAAEPQAQPAETPRPANIQQLVADMAAAEDMDALDRIWIERVEALDGQLSQAETEELKTAYEAAERRIKPA